ncbi:double-strand break repair helicase AddA [Brevundimonas subvibrioides]|uniref:double-strand break repair helicase AddA n=1 Tax=Brevundimonas subvibrioides TaxID=74313 RepID=UPI0022B498A8|nr:double-strand break repair helicase AddA [Brevundimonas subvibrioides]
MSAPHSDVRANDAQRKAADPDLSVFVTANAGSGKTTTLVDRVARLLLAGVGPGEILCVTYTKAAAAEMQARLFEKLGDWAVADDPVLEGELAKLDGRNPAALSGADLSSARKLFAQALETPGGLKIQTIHAFCEKLLRRFPLEAGVSPRFTVLENEAARALSLEARQALARAAHDDPDGPVAEAYSHFAVELNWEAFQSLLAMIESERLKLTAYIDRWEAGEAPGPHVLALADPDRTPGEIEAEFLRFVDPVRWTVTADAMATGSKTDQDCAARMRAVSHPDWTFAGLGPVFLTGSGTPRASMGTKQAPPAAVAWLVDMQAKYTATQGSLRAARVADDTVKVLTLAGAHAALYEAAKRAKGALDFSDLVDRTRALLTEAGAAAWVLFKLDGGIEHVLIDEAQDTAPDQWDIVRALTGEFFSGDGAPRRGSEPKIPRTVFAVGDQKQSIYSFQGARPERLLEEAQYFERLTRGAGRTFQAVPLATSFRSTPEVLEFVDAAFFDVEAAVTPERARALVGATGEIARHTAIRQGQSGCVDLWPVFVDPPKVEREAWTQPVDLESEISGRKRLARALAADIRRQVEAGVGVHEKKGGALRPCHYGDFLVLVRRRDATFEEIIRALKTEGVPVAGADRLKLSSHIVFDDLIAVARFALYPDDDLSLAEVLRSPFCAVPDFGPADSLYELAGADPKRPGLWRTLCDRAGEHPAWVRARAFLQFAIEARDRDPFAFFAGVLNRVDETGLSGRARVLARLGAEAAEALDETLAQVLSAEERGGSDLETCVSLLEAADVEVKREMEGARAEVRVMTVHGAKGLEAPIVILPDTTQRARPQGPGLMPVALPDGSEAWLMCPGRQEDDCEASSLARAARVQRTDEETLRLLYVALTRARDRIVVMGRRSATREPEARSWWDVIGETFGRLEDRGRVEAVIQPGVPEPIRRFGAHPVAVERGPGETEAMVTVVPDWARAMPPVDPSARYVSPSQAKAAKRVSAPSPLAVAGADGGAPLGRFRRGDLIHRLLERLPEIEAAARPDAARRMLARERDLSDDQRDEMIAAAFAVLEDARFSAVFGVGSRAEVALTGSAPGLPAGVSISGRIDRLVVTPGRVLVVDYKTNRPAPDRIEDADPAYVAQMAVYVAVLKRLYPDRPVEAALVWTDGPKLMAVPQGAMDEGLAGLR